MAGTRTSARSPRKRSQSNGRLQKTALPSAKPPSRAVPSRRAARPPLNAPSTHDEVGIFATPSWDCQQDHQVVVLFSSLVSFCVCSLAIAAFIYVPLSARRKAMAEAEANAMDLLNASCTASWISVDTLRCFFKHLARSFSLWMQQARALLPFRASVSLGAYFAQK